MKRQFLLTILLLTLVSTSSCYAQQWGFSTGLGYSLFLGDVVELPKTPGFAINSEIWYELNQKFTIKMGGSIYSLVGDDFNKTRNRSFRSRNMESYISLMYTYKKPHRHWYHRKKVWRPFWYLGLGLTSVDPEGKVGTKQYTNLRKVQPEGVAIPRVSLMIPAGFGIKIDINRNYAIILDGGLRYAFSDNLDAVSRKVINTDNLSNAALSYYGSRIPAGGNPAVKDMYWISSFKIQYIPTDKRRRSKYRKRVTYPKYGYKRRRK